MGRRLTESTLEVLCAFPQPIDLCREGFNAGEEGVPCLLHCAGNCGGGWQVWWRRNGAVCSGILEGKGASSGFPDLLPHRRFRSDAR